MQWKKLALDRLEKLAQAQNQALEFKESSIFYQAKWEQLKEDLREMNFHAIQNERNLKEQIDYLRNKLEEKKKVKSK